MRPDGISLPNTLGLHELWNHSQAGFMRRPVFCAGAYWERGLTAGTLTAV